MKYRIIFSLFLVVALFAGCEEDKGTLQINFVGTYDGDPLVLGQALDYLPAYDITLLESDFYISEIALTKGAEVIVVKDIDFVDFTNNNFNLENAEAGIAKNYGDVAVGTYDGIRFGIGVPPSENAMKPADFNSENPLSKSGYYWDAWSSYIFHKYAGTVDGQGFFFHTGTNELFRTLSISKEVIISADNTSTIKINLDHRELMREGVSLFDIKDNPANHDPLAIGPLEMFVNNYSTAYNFE